MDEKAINRAFQLLNEEIQSIKEGLTQSWKSEKIDKLAGALSKAKALFKPIARTAKVNYTTKSGDRVKYDYAPYPEMIEATKDALAEHGLAFSASPKPDGNCMGILMHESGQWISAEINIQPEKDKYGAIKPQAVGSAMTYMKKYLYMALLNIPTEDDDGLCAAENNNKKSTPTEETKACLSEPEIAEYYKKAKDTYGVDLIKEGMQKILKRTRWGKLTKEEMARLDKWLKSELNKDLDKKAAKEEKQGELI